MSKSGNPNYPPQYAESSLTALIGEINTLAGNEPPPDDTGDDPGSPPSAPAPQRLAQSTAKVQSTGADGGEGFSVPVEITGTRPPAHAHLPGLRELMLGAAITQLAEQIPPSEINTPLRAAIIKAAQELHRAGANKVLKSVGPCDPKVLESFNIKG